MSYKYKHVLLKSFSVAVLLGLAPLPVWAADSQTSVTVTGTGVVSLPPDQASIAYTVRGEGKTAGDAVAAMAESRKKIDQGVDSHIQKITQNSDDVTVQEVRGSNCKLNDGMPHLSAGQCAITGYIATISEEIKTEDVKETGTLIGLVGRLGGIEPHIVSFSLAHPEEVEQQAIVAAARNARQKAESLARGLGITLGPVQSASIEGQYSIRPVFAARAMTAMAKEADEEPVVVDLSPKPVETERQVRVTWRIAP